ncbi:hypothetical protein amb2750 [Paramagnetospirillum magneticum AMB-1]|uniref:YjiS-like domain-containing protein n=2 Tax=Paramagnetospirillum magneticum TaxID=84159 RepID=Q2W3M1_PARM1|nr:hypothetical protein amb2750 [Paramagnetospirillum magneticum AMB-1]
MGIVAPHNNSICSLKSFKSRCPMSLSPTVQPCAPAPVSDGRSVLGLIAELVDSRIIAPLARHMERARLRDELVELDHRELKDIGVSDVDSFVAGWRR